MEAPIGASDRFVRIARLDLRSLRIDHVTSALDPSILVEASLVPGSSADVVTGYTEWAGSWRGAEVTIGWDWGATNKVVFILNPAEIRTNLLVILDDGTPAPPMLTRTHLFEWLETLPWREPSVVALLSELRAS
jgi:hypothetical protein